MSEVDRSAAVAEVVPAALEGAEIQGLFALGQERGFLRVAEVAACLSEVEVTREQVLELRTQLAEQGIEIQGGDGDQLAREAERRDNEAAGPEPGVTEKPDLDLTVEPSLDSLRLYLRSIGRVGLLTGRQEVVLAERIERGDMSAKQHMSRPTCGSWSRSPRATWAAGCRFST